MISKKKASKPLALLALAVVCLFVTWFANKGAYFRALEVKTLDVRFRLFSDQKSASSDIVLVKIDDRSLKELQDDPAIGRFPWPRAVYAKLLEYMRHGGAKLVAFDLMFLEPDMRDPESDRELADETKRAGNVIHSMLPVEQDPRYTPNPILLERNSIPLDGNFPEIRYLDFPLKSIAENAFSLGHVANRLDEDGSWRRSLILISCRNRLLPSLGLAAALALQGLNAHAIQLRDQQVVAGSIRAPLDEEWWLPVWFNGPPETYKTYSFSHVFYSQIQIDNGEKPIVEPSVFENKIVFVGLAATGLSDLFATPYSGSAQDVKLQEQRQSKKVSLGKMPGVEVHANVLDDLLHNRYLIQLPLRLSWVIGFLFLSMILVLVLYTSLAVATGAVLAQLAAYLAVAQWAFTRHLQLPVVPVIFSWSLSVILGFAYQYWIEGAEKRKVSRIFSRYVSKDVYHQLLDNPSAAELGGKRALITVLFSDLRGFTSISEKLSPEAMIAQLNEYFSEMVKIVFQHHGTIDKFVGDMIMALFNAPLPDPEHADHAVQCGIAMNRKLDQMNEEWRQQGRPELHCGVGINSGDMVVGNVGAETIRSYTVIGDNVNLGSRLESQCKEYKAEIIISEFTRALLKHDYAIQELGDVLVKGKSRPVKIFRVFYQPDAVSKPKLEKEAVTK